ncbi:MAG: heme biosynthesis HemY N-terminal domain-containing protein [Arenicellales bacterium]
MKMLIIIILALAAATTVGLMSLDDPGLMVLSYGQNTWELPLVLGLLLMVVAFALLYLLFNFLFGIFRAPKKAKAWNQQRQNKNAQNDTLRGYARLIEGNWEQGEKDLVKRLDHCNTPMLNYLGAAYAAQQQNNYDKRDEYLALAEKLDPANRMAIDITRARMLTQAGDYVEAKALLETMHHHAPANKTVLRLMTDVLQQTDDWTGIKALLPKLEKTKALPEAQVMALNVAAREANLSLAVPDTINTSTLNEYKQLPRKHKKDAQMATMFAKQLINEGELHQAEAVIRKAIAKDWSSELAGLYGKTDIDDLRKQIALATTWLTEHEEDAMVNLTLARLNLAYKQYDKARVYYNTAIEQGAGDEAFYELGQFYETEGNHKTALTYYKKGMQAVITGSVASATGLAFQTGASSEAAESIVMPGAADNALVAVETVEAELIESVEVLEQKV